MNKMPSVIDRNALINSLKGENKEIAEIVVKKNGEIRASKPKVDETKHITGKAAYVWRMVVFYVSPKRQHQCMPMTADFDLPAYDENGKWSAKVAEEMSKTLDPLVDIIIDTIPKTKWNGVKRWRQAFYG